MLQKPELSAGLMDPRGPNADFTFYLYRHFKTFESFPKLDILIVNIKAYYSSCNAKQLVY